MPASDIPTDIRALLPAAIEAAQALTVAINGDRLAVELDRTLALWTLPKNWPDIAPFYREALEDVPADLVAESLKNLRQNFRFNSFPKPADLRASIVAELRDRRATAAKLQALQRLAALEPPKQPAREPPSEEEIVLVSQRAHDARMALKGAAGVAKRADENLPNHFRNDGQHMERVEREIAGFRLHDADDPRVLAEIERIEAESAALP